LDGDGEESEWEIVTDQAYWSSMVAFEELELVQWDGTYLIKEFYTSRVRTLRVTGTFSHEPLAQDLREGAFPELGHLSLRQLWPGAEGGWEARSQLWEHWSSS
jgi:hypothetical protein